MLILTGLVATAKTRKAIRKAQNLGTALVACNTNTMNFAEFCQSAEET